MKWFSKLFQRETYQNFMAESVLMNWNQLNKSILVLVLGAFGHIMWTGWYLFSFYIPEFHQWMNKVFFTTHFQMLSIFLLGYFLMISICLWTRSSPNLSHLMTYASVFYFTITFLHGGYSIGILSPATIASFVSLLTVGLMLFERKVIYSAFLFALVFLSIAIYFTISGDLRYAPVFSQHLLDSNLYMNSYWVFSMLYLYSPVFIVGILLYEILLIQWRNREQHIDAMSKIDGLTGINNRRSITSTLSEAQKNSKNYALILLDLDHFKWINDQYGHEAGDEVLQLVAKILKQGLREHDVVGRFGGEEFILVLHEHNLKRAVEIAERCRTDIEQSNIQLQDGRQFKITASFGVALSSGHLSKEDVIRLADQALYRAKAEGRNQVHFAEHIFMHVS
jgi:diguanylate cyclase (GGDEF)-like protein